MSDGIVLAAAAAPDLDAVKALLLAAGLPTDGVEDQFPDAYLVVHRGQTVIGAGGVERYGRAGLLRSVVVARAHDGRGLGARIVERLLSLAADAGVGEVFLLTTTAADYFERLGFVPIARSEVPEAVRLAPEFASICPASAACLAWRSHHGAVARP